MRIKKFTLLTLAIMMMSVVAFAQKPVPTSKKKVLTPYQQILQAKRQGKVNEQNAKDFKFAKPALPQEVQKFQKATLPFKAVKSGKTLESKKTMHVTSSTDELVTLPEGIEPVTWYTYDGVFYAYSSASGWVDATDYMPSVNVAIDGSDFYIQGLGYFFPEGWVKGTLSGTTVTIPSGQYIGEDEYGPEYIVGSNDAETISDIVFTYDAEAGLLTSETTYIFENSESDAVAPYCYWYLPVFSLTAPEVPTPIEAPDGLKTSEWLFSAICYNPSKDEVSLYELPVAVGLVGNDVYVQGMCEDLPEAWIKGTLADGKVTFPTGQYFGTIEF